MSRSAGMPSAVVAAGIHRAGPTRPFDRLDPIVSAALSTRLAPTYCAGSGREANAQLSPQGLLELLDALVHEEVECDQNDEGAHNLKDDGWHKERRFVSPRLTRFLLADVAI